MNQTIVENPNTSFSRNVIQMTGIIPHSSASPSVASFNQGFRRERSLSARLLTPPKKKRHWNIVIFLIQTSISCRVEIILVISCDLVDSQTEVSCLQYGFDCCPLCNFNYVFSWTTSSKLVWTDLLLDFRGSAFDPCVAFWNSCTKDLESGFTSPF